MEESKPHEDHQRPTRSPRYALVVLALIVLAVFGALGLGRFGYTSILPAMQESLSLTNTQTGELQSWNLLGYMLTVVVAGFLAARFGPRVVIAVSLLVTAVAMALTGLFPTFTGAGLGRFLAGVGGAGSNVPAMALVSAWFGARRRGLATGAAVGGSSVGLMVTGPLIPFILGQYGVEGWRVCWYTLGGMAFVVFALCALFLRNRPEEVGQTPFGETEAERTRRKGAPMVSSLDWSLVYRSGVLWHLAAVYFAFGFSFIIYATFFIRHLLKDCGFTAVEAGALWFKVGVGTGIGGFIWGSVSDRWGRKTALVCVYLLQTASFLLFGLSRELPALYLSAGLFALTGWSIPALMAALSGDVFGARLAPAALGLMTIVFGLGQAIGPVLAGKIADATQSFSGAFVIAGIVALTIGAGGSLLLHPAKVRAKN
jgi:MFS family permease